MVSTAVGSKTVGGSAVALPLNQHCLFQGGVFVVNSLHCLLLLPLYVGVMLGHCFVMLYLVSVITSFAIISPRKIEINYVFLLSCVC